MRQFLVALTFMLAVVTFNVSAAREVTVSSCAEHELTAMELGDNAGRPDGRSDEFWFAARAEFEREEETREGNPSAHVPPHVEAVSSWTQH
jgi:Protein of unknown function (DUF2934)